MNNIISKNDETFRNSCVSIIIKSLQEKTKSQVSEVLGPKGLDIKEVELLSALKEILELLGKGVKFPNSPEYVCFMSAYFKVSNKENYEEIYKNLRFLYLFDKLENNLKIFHTSKDVILYFKELLEICPDFDLRYFYDKFPEKKDLIDRIMQEIKN